jgi:riboflavin transporter FmnP
MERDRFDSVSLAGVAVFGALATLLAAVSQSMPLLNFPVVPWLQFDLGEVAILMAFFIFGPLPAVASSFVEFVALLFFGQNIPIGPVLKLLALLSTVAGMWLGSRLAVRMRSSGVGRMVALSALGGSVARAALMTIPNYVYLLFLVAQDTLAGIEGYLGASFALVGISLTNSNTLALILGFTALFNVMQLAFVTVLCYGVLRFPPISNLKVGGRSPWFVSIANGRAKAREAVQ